MKNDSLSTSASDQATHPPMQQLGTLQQFQAHIAQRIAQAQASPNDSNTLLSIDIQRYRLLIRLTDITELIAMPNLTQLPLSQSWVLGLAVVRAEILMVIDLAHFLDLAVSRNLIQLPGFSSENSNSPPLKHSDTKLVVLNKSVHQQLAFKADKVIGTISPEKNNLTAVDSKRGESESNLLNHYVKQLWRNERGDIHIELSLTDLFKSNDFTNIVKTSIHSKNSI